MIWKDYLTWLTRIRSLRGNGRQIRPSRIELGILSRQLIMWQQMTLLISTTRLVTIMSLMPMAILRSHLPLTECTRTRIGASGPHWRQNWLTCGLPVQARSASSMRVVAPVHGYADWSYAHVRSGSAASPRVDLTSPRRKYNGHGWRPEIFRAFLE